jgi:hypothetical protein
MDGSLDCSVRHRADSRIGCWIGSSCRPTAGQLLLDRNRSNGGYCERFWFKRIISIGAVMRFFAVSLALSLPACAARPITIDQASAAPSSNMRRACGTRQCLSMIFAWVKDRTIACPFVGCTHENSSMFIFRAACSYVFPVRFFRLWRSARPVPESKLQLA